MRSVIYLYEGETEKHLLEALKTEGVVLHGKLMKFNLWTTPIKRLARRLNKGDQLVFLVDTDTVDPSQTFIENIKWLKTYSFSLGIQNKNLEDELCHACHKGSKDRLYRDFYDCMSASEFKRKLIKDSKLMTRLSGNAFTRTNLWSRVDDFLDFCHVHDMTPPSVECSAFLKD